jgi:single-strand DNA-binding protein
MVGNYFTPYKSAMYINKATILGNLTRDPELKSLPSGIKIASFSLATNPTWKDATGAKKDASEFHNIVAFGKQAELIAQYARKGSSLYVEGRIQTRSWDATDGTKKYRTEVVLESFQFGPRAQTTPGGYTAGADQGTPTPKSSAKKESEELDTIEYPEEDVSPEDIPF